MVDLMALFLELVATIIILVTRPFLLIKLSCLFGVGTICIVINTWVGLLKTTFFFHVYIFWRFVVWMVALISLPIRVLTAFQRERLMEMHLHEMQIELQNLLWGRKELEEHLQMAIKEYGMMEVILAELEEEQDQAIVKIELLEAELQDVKDENLRLKDVQGQGLRSFKVQDDTGNVHNTNVFTEYGIEFGIPSQRSNYAESGINFQDLSMHKKAREVESRSKTELPDFRAGVKASGPIRPFIPGIITKHLDANKVLEQRREVALSQSLFSAVLSLLVGMIIWEAEDPCMPLVLGLFTVVVISLKSVIQLFSAISNKPTLDAVALLSFNWFVLGALTYPTLPRVACILNPLAVSSLKQTIC